jgi:hypothetical protein
MTANISAPGGLQFIPVWVMTALTNPCSLTYETAGACQYASGWHERGTRWSNQYKDFTTTVTALVATPVLLAAMYAVYKRNPEWFERHNRLNHVPAVSKAEFRRTMQELDAVRANARNANARDDGERPRPRPARGKRAGSGRQSRNT